MSKITKHSCTIPVGNLAKNLHIVTDLYISRTQNIEKKTR
jgi:hypothetical protein